jgi:hypothetical protein
MEIDLKNFLIDDNSICREERQYALYLYNSLLKCKTINILGNTYDIVQAYYEATFMRDYFFTSNDKKEFNEKLILFSNDRLKELYTKSNCVNKENYDYSLINRNSEGNPEKHINHWKTENRSPIAKWMMNAKPDIALLLRNDKNEYFLYSIECKYESKEDCYTSIVDGDNDKRIIKCRQHELQKLVIIFLCEKLGMTYNALKILPGDVCMAYFRGKYNKKGNIHLGMLIEDKGNKFEIAEVNGCQQLLLSTVAPIK